MAFSSGTHFSWNSNVLGQRPRTELGPKPRDQCRYFGWWLVLLSRPDLLGLSAESAAALFYCLWHFVRAPFSECRQLQRQRHERPVRRIEGGALVLGCPKAKGG